MLYGQKRELVMKLAIGILLLAIFLFKIVMPQYDMGYEAAFQDKLYYAESIEEPKIILMGDSNLAFGIDSEKIEQEIGMPVVNMGLHGGLGQSFLMELSKDVIGAGDIVVVCPCYYIDSVGLQDGMLGWMLLENRLDLWTKVNLQDYMVLWKEFPTYLSRAVALYKNNLGNTVPQGVYARTAFNKFGDIESTGNVNVMQEGYLVGVGQEWLKTVNAEIIDYFNDYGVYVEARGATMLVACPPLIDSPEQVSKEVLEATFGTVRSSLKVDFISEWEDYIFPMEYFYDMTYHLNDVGRVYRTEQLIEDIREWRSRR